MLNTTEDVPMRLMGKHDQLHDAALPRHSLVHPFTLHRMRPRVLVVVTVDQKERCLALGEDFGVGERGEGVVRVGGLPVVPLLGLETHGRQPGKRRGRWERGGGGEGGREEEWGGRRAEERGWRRD